MDDAVLGGGGRVLQDSLEEGGLEVEGVEGLQGEPAEAYGDAAVCYVAGPGVLEHIGVLGTVLVDKGEFVVAAAGEGKEVLDHEEQASYP